MPQMSQAVAQSDSGAVQADVPLRLAPGWRREALQIVGFAQEVASGHVLGAAASSYRPAPKAR